MHTPVLQLEFQCVNSSWDWRSLSFPLWCAARIRSLQDSLCFSWGRVCWYFFSMSAPPSAVASPFALHLWKGLSAAADPLPAASPSPVTRVVSLGVGEGGKGVVKPPCQAGTVSGAVVFAVLLSCPQSHCGPSPKRGSRALPGLA